MFLVTRTLTLQKGFADSYVERLSRHGLVNEFPGFVRKEVLVNRVSHEFDVVRVMMYWRSKEDHMAWEKSPQHIAQHKAQHGLPRAPEMIAMVKETFEVYESQPNGTT